MSFLNFVLGSDWVFLTVCCATLDAFVAHDTLPKAGVILDCFSQCKRKPVKESVHQVAMNAAIRSYFSGLVGMERSYALGRRVRYIDDHFNLDLTYITARCVNRVCFID